MNIHDKKVTSSLGYTTPSLTHKKGKDEVSSEPKDVVVKGTPETPVKITILHTNDIHGHTDPFVEHGVQRGGIAKIAEKIEEEKAKNPDNTLVLDAGDISTGGVVSDFFNRLPIVDSMNAVGYDAMTIGNHEFDMGRNRLKTLIDNAKFPVLAANLEDTSKNPLNIKPYVIKNVGGVKVGIIGLTTLESESMLPKKDKSVLHFFPVKVTAQKYIEDLKKKGVDLIAILSHLGVEEDVKLAKEVKGIDVIIGGHSHTELPKYKKVGSTIITQTGSFGKNLGELNLTVKRGNGKAKIEKAEYHLIPITDKIPNDPEVSSIVSQYTKRLDNFLNRKLGEAKADLTQRDYHKYVEESTLANFVTDAIRRHTRADIVLISPSSLRCNISKGPVTIRDIYNLFPWEDKITVLKMTGKQVKEAMEDLMGGAAKGVAVSGLKIEIDTSKPKGHKLLKALTLDGKPIDDNKIYTVATRTWFANGNADNVTFSKIKERRDLKKTLRKILSFEIDSMGVIQARKDGRIVNHAIQD